MVPQVGESLGREQRRVGVQGGRGEEGVQGGEGGGQGGEEGGVEERLGSLRQGAGGGQQGSQGAVEGLGEHRAAPQVGQVQRSSRGSESSAWRALRRLSGPFQVKACPLRPDRVGSTQSNISTPRSTAPTRSSGLPTPIK